MSSEWLRTTLGKICNSQDGSIQTGPFGSQLHTSDYTEQGTPVVMPTNIGAQGISQENIARVGQTDVARLLQHQLEVGDIVFSRRGDVTKNALIGETEVGWLCGTGCLKVRVGREKIANAQFVSYYLRLPEIKDWLIRHAVGATMPNLNTSILAAVPIMLPPLRMQHCVTEFLSALDDRITLLRETNKTLESIAQVIFKSWFVDFDPVRAKMEGRQPEGMDEATAALFPDSFEESEPGLIPKRWKFSTVGESFILTMGQSPPGDTYNVVGEGLPFYQGCTDFGFRFPSQRVFCAKPSRLAQAGDTLVSVRAPVGDVNMASEQCCIGRGVAAVRHSLNYQGFTFYTMKELEKRFHAYDSEGTVFGSISKKDFQSLNVVAPQAGALNAFNEITTPLDKRIKESEETLRTLTLLRDTLLPRLISGQLRLPDAHQQVEAAIP